MQQVYADILHSVLQHDDNDLIHNCPGVNLDHLIDQSQALLDLADKNLHVFPFKNVKPCWFRLYTDASIVVAVQLVQTHYGDAGAVDDVGENNHLHVVNDSEDWLTRAVAVLDRALIMAGGMGREDTIHTLLLQMQRDFTDMPKQRTAEDLQPMFLPREEHSLPKIKFPVGRFLHPPSLTKFQTHLLTNGQPAVLLHILDHWPALKKWQSTRYWLDATIDGRRLVPVEIGRSYVDEDWGQELITVRKFLDDFILASGKNTGYLAQHDLLKQIPSLRTDIAIPDYCYLDTSASLEARTVGRPSGDDHDDDDAAPPPAAKPNPTTTKTSHPSNIPVIEDDDSEVHLNIWFGPPWTISPLHHDPYHNILCQVVGKKYIRLYAPQYSAKLFPRSAHEPAPHADRGEGAATIDMSNTSSIDFGAIEVSPDEEWDDVYPGLSSLPYQEVILEAGQALYIPVGWWHYVRSISAGISVSFWWS